MHDSLLEEDPWVRGYGDKREAQGIVEGKAERKAEGKAEATYQNIELVVRARFPQLVNLVMERVERMQALETLQKVLIALSTAQNEREAQSYILTLQNER